ncbi:aspartate/glutamate racemase family protein [Piscinibacter sp. HJYY11]|uniref:maleate cis-trans isomerase family protein n=1 Tax=Piscinibacter sp. HJYY11 TaxID=2801333 RepID=UPI00191EAF41|nr:aspartate/glutamate racemase family protein [Piscinibacter sp. HJYY11]MBL0730665.1 Asp/Glu/hydantoin racemase [Piscinibacter sp. HJYY11]
MKRVLLGMLTPSSNTALEPITSAMLAGLPEVSAHFGRFRVTEISLKPQALGQFDMAPILEAARLLADARVDVIAWNGTSSGWLGFGADVALCQHIEAEVGIRCCTSVLALNEIMEKTQRKRFGLVTPYLHDVQSAIVANYARSGFDCVAEQHLNQSVNFSFSEVTPEQLTGMAREVAKAKPQCLTTFCTNLRAAHLAPALEAELGIPVYDTVSTAVWKSLRMCGVDTRRVKGWGSLFEEEIA